MTAKLSRLSPGSSACLRLPASSAKAPTDGGGWDEWGIGKWQEDARIRGMSPDTIRKYSYDIVQFEAFAVERGVSPWPRIAP